MLVLPVCLPVSLFAVQDIGLSVFRGRWNSLLRPAPLEPLSLAAAAHHPSSFSRRASGGHGADDAVSLLRQLCVAAMAVAAQRWRRRIEPRARESHGRAKDSVSGCRLWESKRERCASEPGAPFSLRHTHSPAAYSGEKGREEPMMGNKAQAPRYLRNQDYPRETLTRFGRSVFPKQAQNDSDYSDISVLASLTCLAKVSSLIYKRS